MVWLQISITMHIEALGLLSVDKPKFFSEKDGAQQWRQWLWIRYVVSQDLRDEKLLLRELAKPICYPLYYILSLDFLHKTSNVPFLTSNHVQTRSRQATKTREDEAESPWNTTSGTQMTQIEPSWPGGNVENLAEKLYDYLSCPEVADLLYFCYYINMIKYLFIYKKILSRNCQVT